MTIPEIMVWSELKGKQMLGYKFRQQNSVGPFVVDSYCPHLKLAIEVDGDSHSDPAAKVYDKDRQDFIEQFGIRILRFTNDQVQKNMDGVLGSIRSTVDATLENR